MKASLRIRHHGCVSERLRGQTTMAQVSGERAQVLSRGDGSAPRSPCAS